MESDSAGIGFLPFDIAPFAHGVAGLIELAGITVIVIGAVIASGIFINDYWRRRVFSEAYHKYRGHLGRAILLGLEFLVAADIIGTVAVEPTFRNLGVLAVIVVVRTFLSFSLEVEINGKWPWQMGQEAEKKGSA